MAPQRQTAGTTKSRTPGSQNRPLTIKTGIQKTKGIDDKTNGASGRKTKVENKACNQGDVIDASTEAAPKRKRSGKKKKEKFMEDELLTEAQKSDKLRRYDRWIPDIGHRKRVATRPDSVPYELWMSYCMMDEYIYRQSLTAQEVAALPLIDEVFLHKQDGPKPITPPGFRWDEEKELVPISTQ